MEFLEGLAFVGQSGVGQLLCGPKLYLLNSLFLCLPRIPFPLMQGVGGLVEERFLGES